MAISDQQVLDSLRLVEFKVNRYANQLDFIVAQQGQPLMKQCIQVDNITNNYRMAFDMQMKGFDIDGNKIHLIRFDIGINYDQIVEIQVWAKSEVFGTWMRETHTLAEKVPYYKEDPRPYLTEAGKILFGEVK